MLTLGQEYIDKITGFKGICVGLVTYISGCNQALLSPKVKDGALQVSNWFDVQRLESTKKKCVMLDNATYKGCDKPAPKI